MPSKKPTTAIVKVEDDDDEDIVHKPLAINPKKTQKVADLVFARNLEANGRVKMDSDLCEVFLQLARRGRPLPWICDMLGIPQKTFWRWICFAEEFFGNPEENTDLRKYFVFCSKLKRASKEYLAEILDRHARGYQGEWVKYAWILERLEPKIFGRKDPGLQGPVEDGPNTESDRFL